MARFRLLHASDFHIAQTPYWAGEPTNPWLARLTRLGRQKSYDPSVLDAFAKWIWWNGGFAPDSGPLPFDAILLTGDMAATGDIVDLQEAYGFVDNPPAIGSYRTPAGKPTLAFAQKFNLIRLLAGNHDRYRSGFSFYLPGGTVFDSVFCPGAGGGNNYWCEKQGFTFARSWTKGRAALQIWMIDFSLRSLDRGKRHYGLPGWLGQGRVLRESLYGPEGTPAAPTPASLVSQTLSRYQKAIGQGLAPIVIWAMHFDPFSTDALLQLLNSDLLIAATRKAGVSAILCGHTHESKVKPLSPTTAVFACGTTSASGDEPNNDFQVLEIEVPDTGPLVPSFRVTWYRYDSPPLGAGYFQKLMTVTR